jgi:diamine N-acetyltransferase
VNVSLSEISRENVRAVCDLELADGQQHLVAPAVFTVAEGHYWPGAILRAIYADNEIVGVLLVEMEGEVPYLVRFMIGASRQRQGIGQQAVELLIVELQQLGCPALETSFKPVVGGSEAFWRECGFIDTGRRKWNGSPIFVRHLAAAAAS